MGYINFAVVGRSTSFLIFPILKITRDADYICVFMNHNWSQISYCTPHQAYISITKINICLSQTRVN